jgi:hypothetical protein
VLDQNSSIDEFDRTFASHGIQADGDALASGAHDGSDFPVRQGNVDQNAGGFKYAVAVGKICEQSIEPGWDSIEGKISQTLFGMFQPLANQTERKVVQTRRLRHPQLKLPRWNLQERAGFISHGAVFAAPRSGVKGRFTEERTLRQNVDNCLTIGVGLEAAELDAPFHDGIQGVGLFARAVDKTPATNVH